jgi:hypothetical protein
VIVIGGFGDTVDFGGGDLVSAGDDDIFLAKYDASGVHQWSRRFGGAGYDQGYGVAVDASGNAMVTGFFSGTVDFGGGNLESAGSVDIFLAKYNTSGVHQWSERFGGAIFDPGKAVGVDASGNVVVTGYFFGTVDFGGGNLESAGDSDIFLAKYGDQPTSVPTETVARQAAALSQNFPNPFNPQTTIEYTVVEKAVVSIEIFDASGALVTRLDEGERDAGIYRAQWDGRDASGRSVASGVYFYRLANALDADARKMILLK